MTEYSRYLKKEIKHQPNHKYLSKNFKYCRLQSQHFDKIKKTELVNIWLIFRREQNLKRDQSYPSNGISKTSQRYLCLSLCVHIWQIKQIVSCFWGDQYHHTFMRKDTWIEFTVSFCKALHHSINLLRFSRQSEAPQELPAKERTEKSQNRFYIFQNIL